MRVVHERCCGLDVHKKTVVACLLGSEGRQLRSFGTVTSQLLELADWLQAEHVEAVAMESSGVYWKPVFNVLEAAGLHLLVVNARHMKAVPGRKTDVKDAEWIADLLRHGLLQASFIPDRPARELRELVRYRKTLIEQRGQEVQRVQKLLEGADIKLGDVLADVLGKSGRAMLQVLASGEYDPQELAAQARYGLQKKRERLGQALTGSVGPHQRYLLTQQLRHIEFLEQQIQELDREVAERMRPFEAAIQQLDRAPGLGRRAVEQILAETGCEMSRFPTHRHISSWAKVCPGNHESAGKRRSGWSGKGNPWLRAALCEAAWAAILTKDSYFRAQYQRLAARRGRKRALLAVAHSLLVVIYHLLKDGTVYQDLGPHHFEERDRQAAARHAVRRLQRLGYSVTLSQEAVA